MGAAVSSISISFDFQDEAPAGTDIDSLAVVAGSNVRGKVTMNVKKSFKLAEDLVFEAKGKEKSTVHNPKHGLLGKKGAPRTLHEENTIFHVLKVLVKSNERVFSGKQEFPFTFQIPTIAPASMAYGRGDRGCSVYYKVSASLGLQHQVEKYFKVTSPDAAQQPVPRMIYPTTTTVKALAGVLQQGSVSHGVWINDTTVSRGETIQIGVACRNNSMADLKVQLKLIEFVTWEAGGVEASEKIILAHWECSNLPCLAKQEKDLVRRNIRDGGDQQEANYDELVEELHERRYVIPVHIPPRTRISSLGSLVMVSHYVKIKFPTLNAFQNVISDIPETKIPVVISHRQGAHQTRAASASNDQPVHADWSDPPTFSRAARIGEEDSYDNLEGSVATSTATPVSSAPVFASSIYPEDQMQDNIPMASAFIIDAGEDDVDPPPVVQLSQSDVEAGGEHPYFYHPSPSAPVQDEHFHAAVPPPTMIR